MSSKNKNLDKSISNIPTINERLGSSFLIKFKLKVKLILI